MDGGSRRRNSPSPLDVALSGGAAAVRRAVQEDEQRSSRPAGSDEQILVAVGVLMERHGLDRTAAEAKLRALAQRADVSPERLAREVVLLGGIGRPVTGADSAEPE